MSENVILEIARRLADSGQYDEAQVRAMGLAIGCAVHLHRRGLMGEFVSRLRGMNPTPLDVDGRVLDFVFGLEDRWLVEAIDKLRTKRGLLARIDLLLPPDAEQQALYELIYSPGMALA